DIEGLAFINVDFQGDRLLLLVRDRLGNGAEVDISQLSVELLELFKALANESGIKPVAILQNKRGAQSLYVCDCLVAGERNDTEPISHTLLHEHKDVDPLAAIEAKGKP